MDPFLNPYTPGAGVLPEVLAGRDGHVEAFTVTLRRLVAGATGRPTVLVGSRGMGKTALLDTFRDEGAALGWSSVSAEMSPDVDFPRKMAQLLRAALLELAPQSRWRERARAAAGVLKSFSLTVNADGGVTAGLAVDPMPGRADSGNLADDLADAVLALAEAAQDQGAGVVLLLDEVQALSQEDLEALSTAMHGLGRARVPLPCTLVAAGLPHVRGMFARARSYAERLYSYVDVGPLGPDHARAALTEPSTSRGLAWTDEAAGRVVEWCSGYPYYLQEFGGILWDRCSESVDATDVETALPLLLARLDAGFFQARLARATTGEVAWMQALAGCGPGPTKGADVAAMLGRTERQAAAQRGALVGKGLVIEPGPGAVAFTVPRFDEYLLRRPPL